KVLLGGSNALFLVRILANDFDNRAETVVTSATLVSIRLALSRLARVNSTNPGQQCTMAKVRKSDGEETFVGRRSNDEDAPKNEPARAGGEHSSRSVHFIGGDAR